MPVVEIESGTRKPVSVHFSLLIYKKVKKFWWFLKNDVSLQQIVCHDSKYRFSNYSDDEFV